MEQGDQPETSGIENVVEHLRGYGIAHQVVEHETTMSALAEARATDRSPEEVAKTLVLRDGEVTALAVIPASERLDLHKAREALEASGSLRLATEDEMAAEFPTVEVGAVPPVGPLLPAAEVIDRRLMEHEQVLCAGGDHRHAIALNPQELASATQATVADVCEE
jgi:Ala-tRNA(Pro) deacylase